jgi:hypothetical protein
MSEFAVSELTSHRDLTPSVDLLNTAASETVKDVIDVVNILELEVQAKMDS